MAIGDILSRRYLNYQNDILKSNGLSEYWVDDFADNKCIAPFVYVAGMAGYSLCLVNRILGVVKEALVLIYAISVALCKDSKPLEQTFVFLFSLAELGSGIIGILCPLLAYKIDAYIQSFDIVREHSFSNSFYGDVIWKNFDQKVSNPKTCEVTIETVQKKFEALSPEEIQTTLDSLKEDFVLFKKMILTQVLQALVIQKAQNEDFNIYDLHLNLSIEMEEELNRLISAYRQLLQNDSLTDEIPFYLEWKNMYAHIIGRFTTKEELDVLSAYYAKSLDAEQVKILDAFVNSLQSLTDKLIDTEYGKSLNFSIEPIIQQINQYLENMKKEKSEDLKNNS